jgi:predicted nucleic acid-binding protein
MKKLGRPRGNGEKKIVISSYISQNTFVNLMKKANKSKLSISRLIANILEGGQNGETK